MTDMKQSAVLLNRSETSQIRIKHIGVLVDGVQLAELSIFWASQRYASPCSVNVECYAWILLACFRGQAKVNRNTKGKRTNLSQLVDVIDGTRAGRSNCSNDEEGQQAILDILLQSGFERLGV
jgi:hypothetical protein